MTYLADEALHVKAPGSVRRLATLQLSRTMRFTVRTVMLLALGDRMDAPGAVPVTGLAVLSAHFLLVMMYSARVRHAISDNAIVEVGRPQLAPVRPHTEHIAGPVPVVLYAPTWEGWSDDDCHTSLIPMGVPLIERLLAENVRIVCKPHPLTGKRSPESAAADRAIRELLRADDEKDGEAARLRLQEIRARPDEMSGRHEGDDAQQLRDARAPDRDGAAEWHELRDEWHRIFWASRSTARHHVILDQLPTLYECFNQADLLISDVSSVVADFVAGLKPYLLTNARDLPDEEFRAAYTTAGGAYPLDRACARLPEILRSVREPRHDPMALQRRALKEYVLGPDRPTSMGAVQHRRERPDRQGGGGTGRGSRRAGRTRRTPRTRRIALPRPGGHRTRACRPEVGRR
ncbi:hypothetical protein [Streptomyces canus]|uniref:hypothetical protein n=1 Tax=Streptomyces canus TaxID=58343 RepID=UPI00074697B9|nr:hypothetical protein [Streptomyces canus]KUN12118.1 hypothetical protein AQI96_16335 [Streptomyces canus]